MRWWQQSTQKYRQHFEAERLRVGLITISSLVGNSTGKSAGSAPFRIFKLRQCNLRVLHRRSQLPAFRGLARGSELWSVIAALSCPSSITMEDPMCWEMDYKLFAEQKKAQETRIKQEQRASLIDSLLNEANKQGEKTDVQETVVKEVAPAK
jgi:hypothetical protein